MPIQPSTPQPTDGSQVPSLQILPQLQPASRGAGAWVGLAPWRGLRVGLIALAVAVLVAVPAFALTRDSDHHPVALNVPAPFVRVLSEGIVARGAFVEKWSVPA